MSKTDKTRPWWVRMADAPMATCLPVHEERRRSRHRVRRALRAYHGED